MPVANKVKLRISIPNIYKKKGLNKSRSFLIPSRAICERLNFLRIHLAFFLKVMRLHAFPIFRPHELVLLIDEFDKGLCSPMGNGKISSLGFLDFKKSMFIQLKRLMGGSHGRK